MDPDYGAYTLDELRQARASIDVLQYPRRAAQLDRLIRARLSDPARDDGTEDTPHRAEARSIFVTGCVVFFAIAVLVLGFLWIRFGSDMTVKAGELIATFGELRKVQAQLQETYPDERFALMANHAGGERVVVVTLTNTGARSRRKFARDVAAKVLELHPRPDELSGVTVVYVKVTGEGMRRRRKELDRFELDADELKVAE